MGSLSIVHWMVLLLIVVLVFGTKKLGNIGSDLGKAVKGFKDGVKGDEVHTVDESGVSGRLAENTPVHIISNQVKSKEHS